MNIEENVKKVKREISSINKDVIIVAATKTVSPEIINKLPEYGITIAGENKVQELIDKYDKVKDIEWHFIGQLQTNKVKYIIDKVTLIHSLDRLSLAGEIEKQCVRHNINMNVLIEVNSGEEGKGGIDKNDVHYFANTVRANYKHINISGLMAVMPYADNAEKNKNLHLQMRDLYDTLIKDGFTLKYLSIGMSGDYMTAVKYGANMVRLGSSLFGLRKL